MDRRMEVAMVSELHRVERKHVCTFVTDIRLTMDAVVVLSVKPLDIT